jgi:hypothetical protein
MEADPLAIKPRRRVLIIGSGFRTKNNFLPALCCLPSEYEIVGIHSRTAERLLPVAEHWKVPAVLSLDHVDFQTVDLVIVSVPTSQNSNVLRRLLPHAARLSLLMDTPVAATVNQLASTLPLLRNFKQVLVAEDYMNFPPFALLRKALKDGLLGTLQGLTLYNTGFKYHGMALIRSFNGFGFVRRAWNRKAGAFSKIVGYSFADGYRAIVVGPYRSRYVSGIITLEGSKGVAIDFAGDSTFGFSGNRPVYTLTAQRAKDNCLTGFSLDGAGGKYSVELPEIRTMMAMDFADKSDLNLLKNSALLTILRALDEPGNINNSYGIDHMIYDVFVPKLALRGFLPFDPFLWLGSNVVSVLRAVSSLKVQRG